MSANKTVYIAISSDILHKGHLKIIDVGAKLGDVTIGLLTDESIATYKRLPIVDWESRKALVEHLAGVTTVVPQEAVVEELKRGREDKSHMQARTVTPDGRTVHPSSLHRRHGTPT